MATAPVLLQSPQPRLPRVDAQPIVDLRTGERVCEELLLRMVSSVGEVIAPADFLPEAERTGAVTMLDRLVVRVASLVAARGRRVAMNISARTLADPLFIDAVERAIALTHVPPGTLTFELTETALVPNLATAWRFAESITALGCTFALDDFGAGYAGLARLKHLPFDFVKIDMQFVRDVTTSRTSRAVMRSIVHLAADLEIVTVAEGIEGQRTLDVLRDLGVHEGQGFHIGRPKPVTPLRATSLLHREACRASTPASR